MSGRHPEVGANELVENPFRRAQVPFGYAPLTLSPSPSAGFSGGDLGKRTGPKP